MLYFYHKMLFVMHYNKQEGDAYGYEFNETE